MLPNVRKNSRWNNLLWSKHHRLVGSGLLGVLVVAYVVFWSTTATPDLPTTHFAQQQQQQRQDQDHVTVEPAIEKSKGIKIDWEASLGTKTKSAATPGQAVIDDAKTPASTTDTTPGTTTTHQAPPKLQLPPPAQQHRIAGLSCEAHGGPVEAAALDEMVYWKDIPADATFVTPLRDSSTSKTDHQKYFTFEPDEGGFNNIRMGMETAIALAIAMGRTLVLPPKMTFYLLWDGVVDYGSFYHIDSIAAEHGHLDIITFEEFLQREALTGQLRYNANGTVAFPPHNNRTNWDGTFYNYESTREGLSKDLWVWMRSVTQPLDWDSDQCVAGIPSDPHNATARLQGYLDQVLMQDIINFPAVSENERFQNRMAQYRDQPVPVDASPIQRLSELLGQRRKVCAYNELYQNARVVHGMGETRTNFRLLVHWYAYLFFEDWRQDLHMKRFMRDHFRYKDEIQCAAARIIQAVRRKSMEHGNNGVFDTMHIRRGDFQYHDVKIDATEIYLNNTMGIIPEGSTVFIATDEKNRTFFAPLAAHYQLLFFSDFSSLVDGVGKNYYGMLDQLVASKGRIFFGTYYSTFTGYINRLRGYHSQKVRAPGYEKGAIDSYYYVPAHLKSLHGTMRSYNPVQPGSWTQEFPIAWRLIDTDAPPLAENDAAVAGATPLLRPMQ